MWIKIVAAMLIGYFLGAIPFALVIGKVFYHTDIRQYGSKNLGGGNAGRVLGKKAGLSVMALDITVGDLLAKIVSIATRAVYYRTELTRSSHRGSEQLVLVKATVLHKHKGSSGGLLGSDKLKKLVFGFIKCKISKRAH